MTAVASSSAINASTPNSGANINPSLKPHDSAPRLDAAPKFIIQPLNHVPFESLRIHPEPARPDAWSAAPSELSLTHLSQGGLHTRNISSSGSLPLSLSLCAPAKGRVPLICPSIWCARTDQVLVLEITSNINHCFQIIHITCRKIIFHGSADTCTSLAIVFTLSHSLISTLNVACFAFGTGIFCHISLAAEQSLNIC